MTNVIASIELAFGSIDAKLISTRGALSSIETFFESRIKQIESEAEESLNRARDEIINRLNADQTQLLNKLDPSVKASFEISRLNWSECNLLNYDEINKRGCYPSLLNFVRFSNLYRMRLNEVTFVEREFEFSTNFVCVLAVGKVFIDLNMTKEEGEQVLSKRMLVIVDAHGNKLHELDYRPIGEDHDMTTVPFVAKNRIYILYSVNPNCDTYQVDIFNFSLELQRTVSLSKDIRHLTKSHQEICVQTTINLRFYDLDLNFKHALGQKEDSKADFFVRDLRLTAFNESTLCLFSFQTSQLVFMSRISGQVLSRTNLNRTVFDYLSLFDLRQDKMLFVSKSFRTKTKQDALVINSNGEILHEKVVEFFISELAQTSHGTIILNRGLFRNNQHSQTIRFKTF